MTVTVVLFVISLITQSLILELSGSSVKGKTSRRPSPKALAEEAAYLEFQMNDTFQGHDHKSFVTNKKLWWTRNNNGLVEIPYYFDNVDNLISQCRIFQQRIMKVFLVVALAVVALSHASPVSETDLMEWEHFKISHAKDYSAEEEQKRKAIFLGHLKTVREHNKKYEKGEESYYLAINKFADLSNKEFTAQMNHYRVPAGHVRKGLKFNSTVSVEALPKTVDWRTEGAVTDIKDQGQCGSCWAFSTTGSVEGQTFLKTQKLVSLSEQNLVDCSGKYGNQGCDGGLMDSAFQYIIANKGIDTEASYPYTGVDGKCHYKAKSIGATISNYVDVESGSESDLQKAVANVGPISVAMDASQDSFQLYAGGVYTPSGCSTDDLDHGVLAVGYGTLKKKAYWLIKNSWGTEWGLSGYFMMARNHKNMCGVATMASYPLV